MESEVVFPFGKHKDKPLKEVPAEYILWTYNNALDTIKLLEPFILENNLVNKKDEKIRQDKLSTYVGWQDIRMNFKGIITRVDKRWISNGAFGFDAYYINTILVDNDILTYIGRAFGKEGENVEFTARIKSYNLSKDGVMSTVISHPRKKKK